MKIDIARLGRAAPSRCAIIAPGGWNIAAPRPPTIKITASHVVVGATPIRLSITTVMIGPAISRRARMPAIREPSESELRDRRRELEDHRERARGEQRQPELRNQQRQQRRVDVRVAVDDQVRGRDADDARREDRLDPLRSTMLTLATGSLRGRGGTCRYDVRFVTLNQIP